MLSILEVTSNRKLMITVNLLQIQKPIQKRSDDKKIQRGTASAERVYTTLRN
jgi:hypothetical protein